MSTPPDQPAKLAQLRDTSPPPSRPITAATIERTSLCSEYGETIRRLLQHIILAALLAVRLYMLPLLYLSHKLSAQDDPWYPAIWNLILRPRRALAKCHRCHPSDGSAKNWKAWTNVRDGLFVPVRIFRTLYTSGRMIGDDPNTLPPGPFPLPNPARGGDSGDQSNDEESMRDGVIGSIDSALEAPASASQVYHAALLSNGTLDEILAAFEVDKDNPAMGYDGVVIRRGRNACLAARSHHALIHCQGQPYRTLSLQSSPEEVHTAERAHAPSRSRDVNPCPRGIQLPKTPERLLNVCGKQAQSELQRDDQLPKDSPESHVAACTRDFPEVRQADEDVDFAALDRCPTFVRRHAQSRLPRRLVTGDKQALAMLKDRGAVSTPELVVSPPTPTKRGRLQRRVRPRKNVVKASNDPGERRQPASR
ncbi:hypothetical protein AYO21_00115 [Fonsecaea monophora]|uniref:Uncharacterized protein n=1 Tax=Fonsecaea monophora TaxID=254056 RepID=A0A177FPM1_9EURO|nr:hypothetical protein AYO21_00115 [Fonsecaea monophora]OAG45480.1 hypothetical protein AYO21_00115 [Fonsecaea monophora]